MKLILAVVATIGLSCGDREASDHAKPNIIFIISDDQAYGDYSFMGHPHIETPRIDRLAEESLTFTRGYVTAPLCSPSLASMITGLYACQHGITGNDPAITEYEGEKWFGRRQEEDSFPPNSYPVLRHEKYQTLAYNFYQNKLLTQTLSELGYRSFQTGKWWVGSAEDAGFDSGMTHGDYRRGGRHGDEGLKIGREGLDPVFDFMDQADAADQPFFIWYAPFLPHTPHNPPDSLEQKYRTRTESPFVARYWAMVEWFDITTGQLLDHVQAKGWEDNTIIVYTCDNGWIQSVDRGGYAPRSKRAPHEGGIRTPIMFKYPGHIAPGLDKENLVSNVDLVPTIHGMLGLDQGNLPGINVLDDETLTARQTVFSECYDHDIADVEDPTYSLLYQMAVEKKWKLVLPNADFLQVEGTSREDHINGRYYKDVHLFDLEIDPTEQTNQASAHPDQVARLTDKIKDWQDSLVAGPE